jgi:imidazolonepropionase-like amidohydrolase
MSPAKVVVIVLLVLAASGLGAPRVAAEPLYVHAGRLIDVDKGRVLENRLIRIEKGRIAAVTPHAAPPDGAAVIDWSNKTVLPGLIDLHTHLIGDIQSADVMAPLKASAADDALLGASNARATLRAGFTTVRDVGTYRAFTDVALRNAIDRGLVEGPRMAVAGGYFTEPGGGGEVTGVPGDVTIPDEFRRGVVKGEAEARKKAREFLDADVDLLKVIATGAVLTVGTAPGEPELSQLEIRALVEEAGRRGRKTTAHAHGAEGAKAAIRAGVHSIEHGSLLDEEALVMMKKRGVVLVADIYNGDYIDEIGARDGWPEETLRKNRETTDIQREVFRKAARMGVKIAFGTDAGVFPHGLNARQFPYMVEYGLSPMQAIRAATVNAADLLGWKKDVGAIRKGAYADMIAVDGDPLTDISLLAGKLAVMKEGVVVWGGE